MQLRRITNTQFAVGFVLLAALAVILMAGSTYLKNTQTIPSLRIALPVDDVTVYVDSIAKASHYTNATHTYTLSGLPEGPHAILLGKSGYFPWQGMVTITSTTTADIEAFMIPMKPKYTYVDPTVDGADGKKHENPEYIALVPEWESALAGAGKSITKDENELSVSENDLILTWTGIPAKVPAFYCTDGDCATELPVYHGATPVKEAYFYPDRTNIILFAAGNSVYAIEASRLSSLAESQIQAAGMKEFARNFQPLYKGTDPHLLAPVDNLVTIKDGEQFIQLSL